MFHSPQPGIAVFAGKALVKQHQTIRTVQHQIPGLDFSRPLGIDWQGAWETAVFFVSIQILHADRQGQTLPKSPRSGMIQQRNGKGPTASGYLYLGRWVLLVSGGCLTFLLHRAGRRIFRAWPCQME